MAKREIYIVNKHSFTVDVLPEFAKAFASSNRVSGNNCN